MHGRIDLSGEKMTLKMDGIGAFCKLRDQNQGTA
jgi:hypothetical protein